MADLRELPEFKALTAVHAALRTLKPEGRRRVLEAIHSLLEIGQGRPDTTGRKGPGPGKFRPNIPRR